uniref:Uncharacterized protein n=1 Tax=Arundo donax TaxID=35708 RepID=A0A0A9BMM5_ARUDO
MGDIGGATHETLESCTFIDGMYGRVELVVRTQQSSSSDGIASECRSVEAQVVSLYIIEFDVESGSADRELGFQDLSKSRAQLPVYTRPDPADGHELTIRRWFFASRE